MVHLVNAQQTYSCRQTLGLAGRVCLLQDTRVHERVCCSSCRKSLSTARHSFPRTNECVAVVAGRVTNECVAVVAGRVCLLQDTRVFLDGTPRCVRKSLSAPHTARHSCVHTWDVCVCVYTYEECVQHTLTHTHTHTHTLPDCETLFMCVYIYTHTLSLSLSLFLTARHSSYV